MNEFKTTPALQVRSLDGIYLRAQIGERWENRCLTDLVWEDVERWIAERKEIQPDTYRETFLLQIIKHLHERLRAMGDQMDIAAKPADE
jgi:hypothetical protein